MPAVEISLHGHTELLAALDKLSSEQRREATDGTLMEGADYVESKIHQHHRSRRIRQHGLRKRIWHGQRGRTSVNIGTPTRGQLGIPADAEHYWPAAYNYGYTAKNGRVVEGAHFMEKGFDEAESVVADQIDELIMEQIEEIWSGE